MVGDAEANVDEASDSLVVRLVEDDGSDEVASEEAEPLLGFLKA